MTLETIKNSFIECLNTPERQLYFSNFEDNNDYVILTRHGKNIKKIDIYVGFSIMSDGAIMASIGFYEFGNFTDNRQAGIMACNQANCTVNGKCYIDDDSDAIMTTKIIFDAYGVIKSGFSPEQVLIYAGEIAMDADIAYPIFADALNKNEADI